MKCHHCNQELTTPKIHNQGRWDLSCPNTHAHVKLKDGKVSEYRFYLYTSPSVKHTIECRYYYNGYHTILSSHTKVPVNARNRRGKVIRRGYTKERKTLIKVEKEIPVTIDSNGVLEVQKIFDKLKLYVLFS